MDKTIDSSPICFRPQTSLPIFLKKKGKRSRKKLNKADPGPIPSSTYPYSGERKKKNAVKIPAEMSLPD